MSPAKLLGSLVAAVATLALTASGATAQTPIGPDQPFAGAVNGSTTDADVFMICPGPTFPGQTGHPQAGQSVQVVETWPGFTGGFTGASADRIVVALGPDPGIIPPFEFIEYGVPQDIPTTALLPCSGTGTAVFIPQPASSTAQNATVTLHFVNVAV